MSNQIVISSGAKVRSLEGVLTGTAGIVNSVPLGGANGVATLDALGKVPLSQLPASVVTYLGTWNAATNTPTLTNGVGDVGDLYICNVAGTVNFGAGPITFAVGDWVIYSGTEWQKSSGASGTVTSVSVTESGDALTITGSPITTSGTINIGFAGTGSQYIKGDGTLATFPTTIEQAKRLITEVYNSTGATLSKGTVVYINGGQGNLPTVTKAQANNDANSAQTYGVVQSDITNNNNGFVVVIGSLTDLDTQAYAVGTQLYLSGTTAGEWTSTKPSAPIHLVYVGIVVRSHPTQGVVEIRIQNGYELEELHDVAISSPVNNQGIFYNSSTDLWENKSIATALGYTPANDALVVPYTGATTNVDLGSNVLFAYDLYANGNGTNNANLYLKQGISSLSIQSGYSNILATGTKIGFLVSTSPSAAYYADLQFSSLTAQRTYTLPDLSGTLALLEGTQTFSGNKTFSALTAFTFLNGTRMDYGLYLSKGSVPSAFSGSTVNLYSDSGNNNLVVRDNSNTSLLQFQAASSYTYTFPASSGTIALTSNLSSYVPYTGATADVNLGINSLYANSVAAMGAGSNAGQIFMKHGSAFNLSAGYASIGSDTAYNLYFLNTVSAATKGFILNAGSLTTGSTRTYTLPDATGTIALTSDIPSLSGYVQGSGTTNYHAKFTGTSTIGNSMLTDDGTTLQSIGATRSNLYLRAASSSFYGQLAFTNGSNGSFGGISYNNSGQYMQFETNSSEWMRLTSNGYLGIGTTGPSDVLDVQKNSNATTNFYFRNLDVTNTNSRAYLNVIAGNVTTSLQAINNDHSYLNCTNNFYLQTGSNAIFYTAGSERMRITSSGSLLVGTTSTAVGGILSLNGDLKFGGTAGGNYSITNYQGGFLAFGTDNTERMRITSDGKLLVGATSGDFFTVQNGSGGANLISFYNTSTAGYGITMRVNNNSSNTYRYFEGVDNGGTQRIAIYTNGDVKNTNNSYGVLSDIKLKENIVDATPKLDKLMQVRVVNYNLKGEELKQIGVIAQEVEQIFPGLIDECTDTKTDSETGEIIDLGTKTKSVKMSVFVPMLIKAIQEQQEIINQLSAKVTALENK